MQNKFKFPHQDTELMRRTLQMVQAGEISVSRALEVMDMWLVGRYSSDLLPAPAECHPLLDDDHVLASLESAGVTFQRFIDAKGQAVHCTAGSQDASHLLDGIRMILAARDNVSALL
jgi:hypothetical protein